MHAWTTQPNGQGYAILRGDTLAGYGYRRRCRTGHKIGPLYADDAGSAERLLGSLLSGIPGQAVSLDVPEPNAAALRIMKDLGWQQSFGCARMVNGPTPAMQVPRVYGVTSFEFG